MLPSELPQLPAWASYRTFAAGDERGQEGHVMYIDGRAAIEISADDMYPAVLAEYVALYQNGRRPDFVPEAAWPKVHAELDPDDEDVLSAYWLEVAYQSAKMDVQRAVGGFGINLHVKATPAGKARYQQATSPQGALGPRAAAGGMAGGRDARHHYKRLRGFLIA